MTYTLMYHDIAPSGAEDSFGFPGPVAARYKLTPEQFEQHLDAIAGAGVRVGLLADRPQAALSFDDGGASATTAAAALERRGWRGHFFITTSRIDTAGFLTAEAVADLARRGHEIGSHSHSHPTYMGRLRERELALEWRQSRDVLTGILGSPPESAAVPGGFLSPAVIEQAAAAGYRRLLTSRPVARVRRHRDMAIHGRYTIWSATAPARAAGYAHGDVLPRWSAWLSWEAKTASKRISPRVYETLRQRWAQLHPR